MAFPADFYQYIPYSIILILIGLLIYFLKNPEKVEYWSVLFKKLFAWVSKESEKSYIAQDLETEISTFVRDFENTIPDIALPRVKIEWIESIERNKFLSQDQVIIRLHDRHNMVDNRVYATLAYVSEGIAANGRPYVPDNYNKAINYYLTRKILAVNSRMTEIQHLENTYVAPEFEKDETIKRKYELFGKFDDRGYLNSIVIREIGIAGSELQPKPPEQVHFQRFERFIDFLTALINKGKHQLVDLDFSEWPYQLHFVLVAEGKKLQKSGITPYVAAIDYQLGNPDTKRIYIIGWGRNTWAIKELRNLFKAHSKVLTHSISQIEIKFDEGKKTDCQILFLQKK